MPELPEVEVVKRSLEKKILNLKVKRVRINDFNLRYKVDKYRIALLKGKKIKKIERRSKFLIFEISSNLIMLIHLGMTGKFFFINRAKKKFKTSFYYSLDKNEKHDRIIFYLQNNQKLIYNDVRKFGFIKLYKSKEYKDISHLKNLGPEPLSKYWNLKYFQKYILNRNRNIKSILMDQKFISGLGNIYVNEILFLSRIMPYRKIKTLKNFEIIKIVKNTKKVLKNSIKMGGSSIKDFSSDNGKMGEFQQRFKVYGRKGEKCSNVDCTRSILKTFITNRATFFCKRCQK
ncbi:MAG: bifunctional DNA-formamidopyrimidine glycosylase/DNA-(apurinic or apyrimidinic site) lyase [Pseudomonadota bacterium]|nr:bifunctional DNA-formamidopyrimidine glycosylase/DNA-(apurinic or apyrimidinic site) lyase [Pseudomonadota bacterium]